MISDWISFPNQELMKLISCKKNISRKTKGIIYFTCRGCSFLATVVFFVWTVCRVVFPTNRLSWSNASKFSAGSFRTGELGRDIALSNASSMDRKLDSWCGFDFGLDSVREVLKDRLMLNSHSPLDKGLTMIWSSFSLHNKVVNF